MEVIEKAISMLQEMIKGTENLQQGFRRKLEDLAESTTKESINPDNMLSIYQLNEEIKVLVQKVEKLSSRSKFSEGIALDALEDKTRDKVKESIASSSSSVAPPSQSRKTLQVSGVETLEALFGDQTALCNVFSFLGELEIFNCAKMKVVFDIRMLSNLGNLEKLTVSLCGELEEIIGEASGNNEDQNEARRCFILPNLKHLRLLHLPRLRSVCPPSRLWVCESLQRIKVNSCPNLEPLSLYKPAENIGQSSHSSSLQRIELKSKKRKTWKLNWHGQLLP